MASVGTEYSRVPMYRARLSSLRADASRSSAIYRLALGIFVSSSGITCLPLTAQAQMLSYTKGESYSQGTGETSPAYKVEYRQVLNSDFSVTYDYVNEGHFTAHHPDGYSLEAWYKIPISEKYRISLSAGIGPFYYFDTVSPSGGQSTDRHGLAAVVTVAARGRLWKSLDWIVSADAIDPAHDLKAEMLSVGLGYWLGAAPATSGGQPLGLFDALAEGMGRKQSDANEISLYGVLSVINISGNPNSWGASAEYRYRFQRYFEGTASYIYEGDPRVARRSGVTVQGWPVRSVGASGFEIGAGLGLYAFVDRKHQPIPGQITTAAVAPIISLMASHPVKKNWFIRVIWDRVVSNYSRDADIWRVGLGRTF
jgi:hypothetical protein